MHAVLQCYGVLIIVLFVIGNLLLLIVPPALYPDPCTRCESHDALIMHTLHALNIFML